MIAAAALVGFALLAAALGPRALGSDGASRDGGRSPLSPRWTIVGWQALSLSVVGALVMALLALAAPLLAPAGPSATALAPTWAAVQHHYANPGGALVAWLCLGIAALVLARLTLTLTRILWRARRRRTVQLDALMLVATEQAGGFHLLESAAPAVFCLPGRRPRVVVTTGARELLDDRELALVLAHERAHLGARHDLVLAGSAALARAIPLGLLTLAHSRIAAAAEMHADDVARTRTDRDLMARALLRLTIAGADATTASATGSPDSSPSSGCAAAERVRRLTARSRARRAYHAVLPALATAGILALPVGLALAPAVGATTVGCCDASELGSIPRR